MFEKRITWMSELERKKDGEMRPRLETWANVASYLRRLVSRNLGRKIAADVTRNNIAELSNDILDGKFGVASVSTARHMRRALRSSFERSMVVSVNLSARRVLRPHGRSSRSSPCQKTSALLGLRPFTALDLRRTSAKLAGDLGFSDATARETCCWAASVTWRVVCSALVVGFYSAGLFIHGPEGQKLKGPNERYATGAMPIPRAQSSLTHSASSLTSGGSP
jgi:hypothetical protein